MSVTTENLVNETYCLKLYKDSKSFNDLPGDTQGKILGQHPKIMKRAIQENRLADLKSHAISKAVTLYTINVAEVGKGEKAGEFRYLGKNVATEAERLDICFSIARNPSLIAKLNPAARILFFANLKKSALFQDCKTEEQLKDLKLSAEILKQIQNAYDMQTDYNPEPDNRYWNKCLWPAMAGSIGIGCALTRMHELWRITQTGEDNYRACSKDEIFATAEVLLMHDSFNNKPTHFGFADIYTRQDDSGLFVNHPKKYDESRWLGCPFRYALGMKFEHCARLLIEHPEYRGATPGEITDEDLDTMAKKHGLNALLAEVREKEAKHQHALEMERKHKEDLIKQQEIARQQEEAQKKALQEQQIAFDLEQQKTLKGEPQQEKQKDVEKESPVAEPAKEQDNLTAMAGSDELAKQAQNVLAEETTVQPGLYFSQPKKNETGSKTVILEKPITKVEYNFRCFG